MIVPQFWAEARQQHREPHRRVTVRRFGWSDISLADAEAHAQQRVQEALQQILAGHKLARRERKVAYNGAEGVPIREEIVARHGDTIITRNSYGARCLNTPHVFFADIDHRAGPSCGLYFSLFVVLMSAAAAIGWYTGSIRNFLIAGAIGFVLSPLFAVWLFYLIRNLYGGSERIARRRIDAFIASHPDWHLRIYRTPAGMRLLAMHDTFAPRAPAVASAFQQLGTDPIYTQMCINQNCFRARVSPKPWRIDLESDLRLSKATWPVAPENLPDRNAWIAAYEQAAQNFAACTYVDSVGSGHIHPAAREVQELHDKMCQADSQLPVA